MLRTINVYSSTGARVSWKADADCFIVWFQNWMGTPTVSLSPSDTGDPLVDLQDGLAEARLYLTGRASTYPAFPPAGIQLDLGQELFFVGTAAYGCQLLVADNVIPRGIAE